MISEDLFTKAKKLIPGGVNSPVRAFRSVGGSPFFTKKADGCKLTTADDRELIDYVCTWGPAIHGHNNPIIKAHIAEALENGTSFGTPNPYEVEIAEMVVQMVPSVEKVRFCNSGTEATMSCIRLARGFTKRDKIIKFSGCYHGHVDSLLVKAGSGALTLGNPDSAGIPASFAEQTIVLDYNDGDGIEKVFKEIGDQIAAVIVEPYPANCGLIFPHDGFLEKLREHTQKAGSLLIFDEVMTGFRLAKGGVQELTGIIPDLTAMGKIIGGGLPVGAFGGRVDIMDHLAPLGPVYQAGTLSGNPLAMAAGIASLKLHNNLDPFTSLESKGKRIADCLKEAAYKKGIGLQVPQAGSMFAIFFSDNPILNYEDAIHSETGLFKKIFNHALSKGVYLPPSPFETCFISTAHTDDDVNQSCEVFQDAISSL